MSLKKLRAECREQGMVYDAKTRKCRARKRLPRLAYRYGRPFPTSEQNLDRMVSDQWYFALLGQRWGLGFGWLDRANPMNIGAIRKLAHNKFEIILDSFDLTPILLDLSFLRQTSTGLSTGTDHDPILLLDPKVKVSEKLEKLRPTPKKFRRD